MRSPTAPARPSHSMRRTNSTLIPEELSFTRRRSPLSQLVLSISDCFASAQRRWRQAAKKRSSAVTSHTQPSPALPPPPSSTSSPQPTFVEPILTFDESERGHFGVASISGLRPYNEDTFRVIPNLEAFAALLVQADVNANASLASVLDRVLCASATDADDERAARFAAWVVPAADRSKSSKKAARVSKPPRSQFYGVYDGHAGKRCSSVVAQMLPLCLLASPAFATDVETTLRTACLAMDKHFLDLAASKGYRDGCTAISVVVRDRHVTTANIGDCRAVLCSCDKLTNKYFSTPLSKDQKPNCEEEKARIEAAGGIVLNIRGIPRVNGMLAVARAFGDLPLKRYISADPALTTHTLSDMDEYIVIATDGLWDVFTNDAVCTFLRTYNHLGLNEMALKLANMAVELGSTDNITVVVIDVR
ncbi:Aste57867_18673 [Aphanomyces stellatus]|uniref:Aste57867_18673 protein n=1 Tax=Aphanomyces stellatus TaxID=120398 RepID=A0A485LBL0_9STRA|nr:hypothetical protein As57867_018611 [Aphanomyces stellatus]VFT95408.1 Aste57867_18673 [Aphanomyces stellatus]